MEAWGCVAIIPDDAAIFQIWLNQMQLIWIFSFFYRKFNVLVDGVSMGMELCDVFLREAVVSVFVFVGVVFKFLSSTCSRMALIGEHLEHSKHLFIKCTIEHIYMK